MEEYDGFSNVNTYKLDRIPIWARIQGVPEGLMKKKELAEKVAKKVGQLITVVANEGKINLHRIFGLGFGCISINSGCEWFQSH
jgi:hypothetical protein